MPSAFSSSSSARVSLLAILLCVTQWLKYDDEHYIGTTKSLYFLCFVLAPNVSTTQSRLFHARLTHFIFTNKFAPSSAGREINRATCRHLPIQNRTSSRCLTGFTRARCSRLSSHSCTKAPTVDSENLESF